MNILIATGLSKVGASRSSKGASSSCDSGLQTSVSYLPPDRFPPGYAKTVMSVSAHLKAE